MQTILGGLHSFDFAILLARLLLGGFFFLARFRYFFDPSRPDDPWCNGLRHRSLCNKMGHCGYTKFPDAMASLVAAVEVLGGMLVIIGWLTVPAAAGLLVVTLFATACTWKDKIYEQHPVDAVDCVSCYLWRVEGLYIGMALMIILAGPGAYSLDALL